MTAIIAIAPVRERRDHKRFLALQAGFKAIAYQLDPLTEDTWMLQCPVGCHQVLRSLDEAKTLLKRLEQRSAAHDGRA